MSEEEGEETEFQMTDGKEKEGISDLGAKTPGRVWDRNGPTGVSSATDGRNSGGGTGWRGRWRGRRLGF